MAAVVVYGNPLGLSNPTIAEASTVYGPRSRDYCNDNDSVCGRYRPNGSGSHLSYASNGTTTQGAQFAANLVNASAPTPTLTPTTPAPSPTPTAPAPATCIRSSTWAHVNAGRAVERFDRAYARGSADYLGSESIDVFGSLSSTAPDYWTQVRNC